MSRTYTYYTSQLAATLDIVSVIYFTSIFHSELSKFLEGGILSCDLLLPSYITAVIRCCCCSLPCCCVDVHNIVDKNTYTYTSIVYTQRMMSLPVFHLLQFTRISVTTDLNVYINHTSIPLCIKLL